MTISIFEYKPIITMKYFPILLSKAGELKAIQELSSTITRDVVPVVQILNLTGSIEKVEQKLLQKWTFDGNKVILDFSLYQNVQNDLNAINSLFVNLLNGGVNIIPAVHYGINAAYFELVRSFISRYDADVCIRTSSASGGFVNFNNNIRSIIETLNAQTAKTIILIDLGFVQVHNHDAYAALALSLLRSIDTPSQWLSIVLASGSFPTDLTNYTANRVHRLQRYEWNIWAAVRANTDFSFVNYGDYGNKNPVYEGEAKRPGSCSIKYTTPNEFVIYRGQLAGDHAEGNGQYIVFASRLITTPDYSGVGFSWGDHYISRIASQNMNNPLRKPGSATTWVEITQNHHMTLLNNLL